MLVIAQIIESQLNTRFINESDYLTDKDLACKVKVNIDSYSDAYLVTQVVKALKEAPWCILYIVTEERELPIGTIAPVVEAFVRVSKPKLLVLQGSNKIIESMGTRLGAQFKHIADTSEFAAAVQEFTDSIKATW